MQNSSILTLLGSGRHNLHETYQCRMYSRRLLMMGKEVVQYMKSFITEQIWVNSASVWLLKKKMVTTHVNMNVTFCNQC
jgi:hypothetical protein